MRSHFSTRSLLYEIIFSYTLSKKIGIKNMAAWTYLIMAILAAVMGVFIFLTISTERGNSKKKGANILYPFYGVYPSPGNPNFGSGMGLRTKDGNSQIKCPSGSKVNIIGAWVEVNDPFGECGKSPSSIFKSTCGIQTKDYTSLIKCQTDGDCGDGMECAAGTNYCVPKGCSSNSDCSTTNACVGTSIDPAIGQCMFCRIPNGASQGYCAQAPTCQNIDDRGNNTVCAYDGSSQCRPRDSSAYLAKYCDGKQNCFANDDWFPDDVPNPFGPLPCQLNTTDTDYGNLPVIAGWDGGTPSDSSGNNPASYNQGYYVHGIYTCIPNS